MSWLCVEEDLCLLHSVFRDGDDVTIASTLTAAPQGP